MQAGPRALSCGRTAPILMKRGEERFGEAKEDLGLAMNHARLTRRTLLRMSALAGGAASVIGLSPWRRSFASGFRASVSAARSGPLPDAITAVMSKPRYAAATWNLYVTAA